MVTTDDYPASLGQRSLEILSYYKLTNFGSLLSNWLPLARFCSSLSCLFFFCLFLLRDCIRNTNNYQYL